MRRFELVEGSSSKFWEIDASGETLTVRFGRIGTGGQTQTRALGSVSAALVERDKLVREKVRKGYAEVAGAPTAATPLPAPAAAPAFPEERRGHLARWPASYVARVYPTRGVRAVAPRLLPWSRVVEQARGARPAIVDETLLALHAQADALLACEKEPASIPRELAGILLARVGADAPADPRRAVAALVDAWVRGGGPAFAVECAMYGGSARTHGQLDASPRLSPGRSSVARAGMRPWLRIREHLSAAPDDVYRSALASAERCFAAASDGRSTEAALVGLAFAFPGERFASELRHQLDAAPVPRLAPALALSLSHPGDAADLLDGLPSFASALWLDDVDYEGTYLTLLAMHGEAIEPAVRGFGRRGTDRRGAEAILAVLAMTGTEAAFEQVLRGAHQKPARDVLDDAVKRAPEVAARVLARHVDGKDQTARRARTLLAGLVAADASGAVREALDAIPAAVQDRVAGAVAVDGTPVEEARPDELPAVMLAPPWLPGRRPPPQVVADVQAPPVAEELVGGARDAGGWPSELRGETGAERLAWLLYGLGLIRDRNRLRDLTEAEGLAALREAARVGRVGTHWIGVGLSREVRNAVLRELPPSTWKLTPRLLQQLVLEEGVGAIDILLLLAGTHLPPVLAAMHRLRSPRLAVLAAAGLVVKKEDTRTAAEAWLGAHPEAAAAGLLAAALGRIGAPRTGAETALRHLDAAGHGAVVRDVARRAGVGSAIESLLAADPRDVRTMPCPTLPPFVQPAALPPLVTRSGRALSAAHTETFARLLALSTLERAEPGVAQVREELTRESVEAFSWALFQAWLDHGAPTREVWAFTQLALIGGDRAARDLAPLVRRWPGESAHARAVRGLEILAAIGSDVALMHLDAISQKGKFKALLERARVLVREVAARRGLTPSQLGDRLIPHLGLEPDGTLTLDLGARSFQVGFDEQLHPFVRGADGKRLADLPKPRADDDPARAAEAAATWKALKKDVRAIAKQQIARLETAMVQRRRWPVEELRAFILDHPLLVHLARRIVWGVYSEHGELLSVLRVAEDRSFADGDDEVMEVPPGASIGVVHPVELTAEQLRSLSSLFADYEILQPFEQLGRVVHVVAPGEEHRAVHAWIGRKVPSVRIVALEQRGWRRGEVWDAGIVHSYERAAGDGIGARLDLDPGIPVGSPAMFPEQTLQNVSFGVSGRGSLRIATSEILRDLALLEG